MMSTKKYRIRLTTDEQQELNALVSRGRAAAYKQTHARILLMSDESRSDGGMKDADITSALGVGQSTVERIRKRCVEEGVESALNRKKQLRRRQKRLDGEGESRLIAMACGEPPEGRASWTLKLLADQLVECEIVGTISTETVRQALKKNELKPWLKQSWCIPPGQSAEFVCAFVCAVDQLVAGAAIAEPVVVGVAVHHTGYERLVSEFEDFDGGAFRWRDLGPMADCLYLGAPDQDCPALDRRPTPCRR